MESKGQVTIFIILGIVIVVAVVMAYFFGSQVLESEWERERVKAALVPPQAALIKGHVDSCIKDVGERAIQLLGSQAGYIDIPEDLAIRSAANPFSNSLSLGGGAEVPYWYYQSMSGVQKEQIPTKKDMKLAIEKYVDENLGSCINFDQFGEQGYGISAGRAISEVSIEDEVVLFRVKFPIKISLRDFEFEFTEFYEDIEYGLGRLHELAIKILETENLEMFLENKTLDNMVVYDEIPYSGVDFECTPRIWNRQKVVNDIKEVMEVNIPFIKIENTDYVLSSAGHKYFEVDADVRAEDVGVNFLYSSDWPTYIDIVSHPGEELLRGEPYTTENEAAAYLAGLFCLNEYHFVYDIKYPVLVSLADGDFIFQFATMVLIDNNQPRKNSLKVDYTHDIEAPICDKGVVDTTIYAVGTSPGGRLNPLEGAAVRYKCINTVCEMGTTGKSGLNKKFPFCVNGQVQTVKDGYWIGKELMTSDKDSIISVVMDKFYDLKVDVRLTTISGDVRNLAENERAVFNLRNIDNDYVTSIIWPGSEIVRLTAGTYEVKSQVFSEGIGGGIKVPGRDIQTCVNVPKSGILGLLGGTESKCTITKLESTTMENALIGGANFEWEVAEGNLASGNTVLLYGFRDKVPRSLDDVGAIAAAVDTNAGNALFKKPEIR